MDGYGYNAANQASTASLLAERQQIRPADLSSLQQVLEQHVELAQQLAIRAGLIADQVFGSRPEATGTGIAPSAPSLASTIERLDIALNSINANLNRL